MLRDFAFLNTGVKLVLKDERAGVERSDEMLSTGGIKEYVQVLNHNKEVLTPEPVYMKKRFSITTWVLQILMNYIVRLVVKDLVLKLNVVSWLVLTY